MCLPTPSPCPRAMSCSTRGTRYHSLFLVRSKLNKTKSLTVIINSYWLSERLMSFSILGTHLKALLWVPNHDSQCCVYGGTPCFVVLGEMPIKIKEMRSSKPRFYFVPFNANLITGMLFYFQDLFSFGASFFPSEGFLNW